MQVRQVENEKGTLEIHLKENGESSRVQIEYSLPKNTVARLLKVLEKTIRR